MIKVLFLYFICSQNGTYISLKNTKLFLIICYTNYLCNAWFIFQVHHCWWIRLSTEWKAFTGRECFSSGGNSIDWQNTFTCNKHKFAWQPFCRPAFAFAFALPIAIAIDQTNVGEVPWTLYMWQWRGQNQATGLSVFSVVLGRQEKVKELSWERQKPKEI